MAGRDKIQEENYVAAMVLAGVGDAMGYKCGQWEFDFVGEHIHKELKALGGVNKLKIKTPEFMVSDDTVLLLSTADSLVTIGKKLKSGKIVDEGDYYNKLYAEFSFRYQNDVSKDMNGRAPGNGTMVACRQMHPLRPHGWEIPFNSRGGGCGAAMRAMAIGLRYPNMSDSKCIENLIRVSVESGRMTHNCPTGYLGSFATALFGAFAVSRVPLIRWGKYLVKALPHVQRYVVKVGRDVEDNQKNWAYFGEQWAKYLETRGLTNGDGRPKFPEKYGVAERDAFYKSVSFSGWGGASGHDAPMIAYDALLAADSGGWEKLCHHGMLHGGDNDSSGVIAGFCYGAMHGFEDVSKKNHAEVEKRKRLVGCGEDLYTLAKPYIEEMGEECLFEEAIEQVFGDDSFIYPVKKE